MHYYFAVLKKYAVFSGRARRSEYWYFFLFTTTLSLSFKFLDFATRSSIFKTMDSEESNDIFLFQSIYSLAVFLPSLAVAVRRIHDVGKSGWFILVPFYNLYLTLQPSEYGPNQYGPNPIYGEQELNLTLGNKLEDNL